VAKIYRNLGNAYEKIGNYNETIHYFEKALQIYIKRGDNSDGILLVI